MKKSTVIVIFILFVAFATSSCKKKNYPSDIPKWLKEKIDGMNKDYTKSRFFAGEKLCNHIEPRKVEEYTDGSSTYYWIGSRDNGYIIYDVNGYEVCNAPFYNQSPCGNYGYSKTLIRKVWEEDCK